MRISDWSSDVCSSDLLAHDDAIRPHAKRVLDEVALSDLAPALDIGRPGFEPRHMPLLQLKLGRILNGADPLAVVDIGGKRVQQGRLARSGAAGEIGRAHV